jgi:hypothetical protein
MDRAERGSGGALVLTVSKDHVQQADADSIGAALTMVASAARSSPATIYVHVDVYREAPLIMCNEVCLEGLAARPGERLPCPLHLPRAVLVAADAGQPIILCTGKGNVIRNFHFVASDASDAQCVANCLITQPVAQPISPRFTIETRLACTSSELLRAAVHQRHAGMQAGAGIAAGVS